jgi:nucleoside-diphosphate-sugar epimerase
VRTTSNDVAGSEQLQGRRVLVTGAAGRIGSEVVSQLNDCGAEVVALTDKPMPDRAVAARTVVGDARNEDLVADALEGGEAVVPLAALAHRDAGPAYTVFSTNVTSTFNVLAQAGARGIGRAVLASSINAFGVPLNHHDVLPAYFPIDEEIPVDHDDWYSLSKFTDERTAAMAWRHWGLDSVALRLPHVNTADNLARVAERYAENPVEGVREGWTCLDVRDAARAVLLGLTAPVSGSHSLFLAGPTTAIPYRTEELLDAFAPRVPRLRRFTGREVPMRLSRAKTLLGFEAHHPLELPTLDLPDHLRPRS